MMATSNREIKYLIMFFLLCVLFACKDRYGNELNKRRILYKKYSLQQIGNQEYMNVFKAANDSLKTWTNNHLSDYVAYEKNSWYLDSLICFNEDKDRCIIALSYLLPNSSDHDGMEWLYGIKVNEKWYFFRGGGQFHLSREFYLDKDSLQSPLSIKYLNQIAMKNIYNGYLRKNQKGEWAINDAFFTAHFEGSGWGDFEQQSDKDTILNGKRFTKRKEYFNSIQLRKVKNNWLNEGRK